MKWTVLFCMFVGGLSVGAGTAPTVSDVRAQQRWPWNALVDIDYILGGDTDGLAVEISVKDRATGTIHRPMTYLEKPSSSVGAHRVTWDSHADGVTGISTDMVATVSLLRFPLVTPSPKSLYCVVDLSGGTNAVRFPVTMLSSVPKGGWTSEYKTTKLVLRRIEPGSFMMGNYMVTETSSKNGSTLRSNYLSSTSVLTTVTQPYYVGIFEVTCAQWNLVMGTQCKSGIVPKDGVSYVEIRGKQSRNRVESTVVDALSFLGRLRSKTGIDSFDLPTEAQWEYACRAGTVSLFNNGGDSVSDVEKLGNYYGRKKKAAELSAYDYYYASEGLAVVGSYLPNSWGLYDMHGNCWELCRDVYTPSLPGGGIRLLGLWMVIVLRL